MIALIKSMSVERMLTINMSIPNHPISRSFLFFTVH